MRKQVCVGLTALALATLAVPAWAQNFLTGSLKAIGPGYLRMTGAPTHMFGRDGAPDRTGGAFRMGYGLSDSFGLEGKAAVFDGVTLVGGDGHYRLFNSGDTTVSLSVGGHQAVMSHAPDSTALDLAAEVHTHATPRLDLYGGTSFSYEFVDNAAGTDFARVYVVPGIRYALANRVDLLVEGGIGLNRNSPHYVAAGFAWRVPASASARERDRR
jgi:hypothetical protein